jgi:hypothetical protein
MTKPRGLREHHGLRNKRAYGVWCGMNNRCRNKNDPAYPDYGGRGIAVCDAWKKFSQFYADMGDPPSGHSIDRIDNDGNYEPGNCRWATRTEQSRNRRNNVLFTFKGETHPLSVWAARFGLKYKTVHLRVRNGWDIYKALSTPPIPHINRAWKKTKRPEKTECLKGHPLEGYNLYIPKSGKRTCRTCAVERTRQWRKGAQNGVILHGPHEQAVA